MALSPTWKRILKRYALPTRLHTVRKTSFMVVAHGAVLLVTPESTGTPRTLTQADYEETAPPVGGSSREALRDVSRNASYIIAIVADLGGRSQ